MKRKYLFLISLAIIVLAALFAIPHTYSAKDTLLQKEVSALADEPTCDWFGDSTLQTCYKSYTTDSGSGKIYKCNSNTGQDIRYQCAAYENAKNPSGKYQCWAN